MYVCRWKVCIRAMEIIGNTGKLKCRISKGNAVSSHGFGPHVLPSVPTATAEAVFSIPQAIALPPYPNILGASALRFLLFRFALR